MQELFYSKTYSLGNDKKLTTKETDLLAAIICLSRERGYCYMRQKTLGKLLELDVKKIQAQIKKLKKLDYIAAVQTYTTSPDGKLIKSVAHLYPKAPYLGIYISYVWLLNKKQRVEFLQKVIAGYNKAHEQLIRKLNNDNSKMENSIEANKAKIAKMEIEKNRHIMSWLELTNIEPTP